MFKPRFQFLNKLLSNSFPKSKPSFNFNLLRTFSTPTYRNPVLLHNEIFRFVAKSPESSVVPLLEQHYVDNSDFQPDEDIRNVIRKLRRQKRFDRALEVSEWMMSKTLSDPMSGDLAAQLSLIGLVHGFDAAEKFFKEVDVHSEKMYGALLNCYVEAKLVDKSLSHFEKMKNMGLAMSALPYNNIMTLYLNTNQDEKVPELLSEMEVNGVSPDNFSYRICFKSFASRSDFASMVNLLRKMEGQHGLVIDWLTYAVVANYYIEGGFKDNAFYYLNKAELKVTGNPVGCNTLITSYAKIGGLNQVMNLWRKRRGASKARINADYMTMISSLVKLDQLEEAERFLQEWESCCSFYDFRVVNVLLLGYTQKGMVEKAEKLLNGIISRKLTPAPNTWSTICSGHIKCGNMHKALLCLKKALELGLASQHRGWIPNCEVMTNMLKWLGDEGEVGELDEFLKLYSKVVPMNEQMYQTLLTANIRHGNETDGIVQRMKDENIEISEETRKIITSRT